MEKLNSFNKFNAVDNDFVLTVDFLLTEEKVDFLKPLENQKTSQIPDTITFECELSVPGVSVEWMKGDRAIKKSNKYDITSDGTVHRLIIKDVDGKDVGDYSVSYKNKKSNATLSIEGPFIWLVLFYDILDKIFFVFFRFY